ncbi:shikimate kinase [Bradymonas sediminis]|uniref:Uncharacterized protein n=1 Tax=Bradymonas sediminis TaxID=1548548 RepID=A0A2Z4FGE4_9DELT|nr:shikimate kinase [Bradymonas sediminis]AWV88013.1 hypothetical protein DN745_01165 [Bradymonas sediminis]TDP77136.1 shikimate kinase [Bradymonas sediminis]
MNTPHSATPILLIGHRGTGKTTLGPRLAEMLSESHAGAWSFVDLDAEIERVTGKTPAAIIAEDEATFRRIESEALRRLLNTSAPRTIIAPGAGCAMPRAQDLVVNPLFVWLWRDGWEDEAKAARARLRDAMSFEEEVRWMRETREPAWAAVAHLFVGISRARTPELAARMLADSIRWTFDARHSAIARRSWLVPASAAQLERAMRDAELLGLGGVEIRSDLCADFATQCEPGAAPLLASLRSASAEWLEEIAGRANTHSIDIDLEFLDDQRRAKTLERVAPRPLFLSAHPPGIGHPAADRLLAEAAQLRAEHPAWAPHIRLKYAPTPTSFAELRRCFEIATTLQRAGYPTTFLPQGARFAWTRPILSNPANGLALENASNYLPVGLRATRLPASSVPPTAAPSPMDLQDWLPHFARLNPTTTPNHTESFDGLIGDPVSGSVGDWWHTQAAIASGEPTRYLKIQLGRDDDDVALDEAFGLFEELGLRGLSVTAPLKRRMQRIVKDSADAPLNTLRRTQDGWVGRDTDEFGMLATLREIMKEEPFANASPDAPLTVSVIGRGGVSPAVLRAIDAAGWKLVEHASAREGWKLSASEPAAQRVHLVINAAGPRPGIADGAPGCDIWLDLHYNSVAQKPDCADAHWNGDVFFEAQAKAQRVFWRGSGE